MSYQVEPGVKVPTIKRCRKRGGSKYPFFEMNVGDSFVVPTQQAAGVRRAAHYFSEREGWRFITRTVPEGLRVWRIA